MKREAAHDNSLRLPLGELVHTLLRWSPVVLVAAALAAAALYTLTREDADPQATARVGNTEDVRWPRDDVIRDLLVAHFDDPAVLEDVRATLEQPDALVKITTEIPPNQAYVEILVSASDEQSALQAANAAAEIVVGLENRRITEANEATKLVIVASLEEFETRIAELDGEIQLLANIEGEAYAVFLDGNAASDRATWQVAEANLSAAENSRSQETWRRNDVLRELDQVNLDLADADTTVVVSRPAQLDEDIDQAGVLPAVLAGLTAAIVVGLAAVAIDRVTGRTRSVERVAANVGRHTFDLSEAQSTANFILDAAVRAPGAPVAVLSPDSAATAASILARGLHTPELVSLTPEMDTSDDLMDRRSVLQTRLSEGGVIQLGRVEDRVGELMLAASLTSVAYLAVDENTRMRDVWTAISAIESRGMTVFGLVFGGADQALPLEAPDADLVAGQRQNVVL